MAAAGPAGPLSPLRFHSLDLARALAALWVFAYHTQPYFEPFGTLAHRVVRCGYLGLHLFFVISGFCMMASARRTAPGLEGAGPFLGRRLRRVYPPLWLAIAAAAILPLVDHAGHMFKARAWSAPDLPFFAWSPADWLGVATLTRVFAAVGPNLDRAFSALNPVYWTLAIEVQFYLVMALALACGRWRVAVLWSVTAAGTLAMARPEWFPFGLFLRHWPGFALGLGLYLALERGWSLRRVLGRWAGPGALVLVLGGLGAYLRLAEPLAGRGTPFFWVLCALGLWTLHGWDGAIEALRRSPRWWLAAPARVGFSLGVISYSIYLLHVPLSNTCRQVLFGVLGRPGVFFALAMLALTCAMCYPFYRWCERPFAAAPKGRKRQDGPAPEAGAGELRPALATAATE